jgi:hypothetical protein
MSKEIFTKLDALLTVDEMATTRATRPLDAVEAALERCLALTKKGSIIEQTGGYVDKRVSKDVLQFNNTIANALDDFHELLMHWEQAEKDG